jgi:tetratricopeptide (TPR) repeat protein
MDQTAASAPAKAANENADAQMPSTESKADYSKEAFVVEQLHERYRFENDGTGSKVATLRVHVLTEAGVRGFGQLRFGYNSANDRIEIGYVRVIKPDGSIVTAGADSVQDLNGAIQLGASLATDDAISQVRLGQAYLNLGQDDKAMAAFDKAVKISATPSVWNDIAYQLTLKNVHLDLARRYAESAVSGTSSRLRNISPDQIKQRDLGLVSSLGSSWDTLGWVAFAEGKLDVAEKYLSASWQLQMNANVADHLGQLYEKQGKKDLAQHFYALALNARRPEPETRSRLSGLAGNDAAVDAMVERYRDDLQQQRTVQIHNTSKLDGDAEFFILQSPGAGSTTTLDEVSFVRETRS